MNYRETRTKEYLGIFLKVKQKKDLERKYLNLWIKNQFNSDELIVYDYETPDFILKRGESLYGIEVTEFYNDYSKNGSLYKKQQKHLDKVWSEIKVYLQENHPYHRVTITYNRTKNTNIDFNEYDIVRILESNINYVSPLTVVKPDKTNLLQVTIEIKCHQSGLVCLSMTDYNGFDELSLIKIIDEKSEIKKFWDNSYNKSILVIHTSLDFSNNINPPKNLLEDYSRYNSFWDGIFLMFHTNVEEFKIINVLEDNSGS